jgi:lipopolysaccharide export LptBFGC system permease protein LptF
MRILARYCFRGLRKWFLNVVFVCCGFVGILEFIDQIRRGNPSTFDLSYVLTLKIVLLKLPSVLLALLPSMLWIVSILFLWELKKNQEWLAMAAAGVSNVQILRLTLYFLGSLWCASALIWQPIAAVCNQLAAQISHNSTNQVPMGIVVNATGLWLQDHQSDGYYLIHAQRFDSSNHCLDCVTLDQFDTSGRYLASYESQRACIEQKQWRLINGFRWASEKTSQFQTLLLPSSLQSLAALDPVAPPEQVSLFQMPGLIRQLHHHGFPTTAYRYTLHVFGGLGISLLASMMLAFAWVSWMGHSARLLGGSVVSITIVMHFLSELMQAIALAERLPSIVGAHLVPLVMCGVGWIGLSDPKARHHSSR